MTSCKSHNNTLIEFDPRSLTENQITLTGIADDINYIPLDNSYPLGLIYRNIEFINNSIYLSVKDIGILVFNKEGKIQRKIGSVGRGPGEYIYNYLFTVDDKTETVYVWDSGQIIKVYSKTGRFLRSFSAKEFGEMVDVIESFNSKIFVSYETQWEDTKYEWTILDTLGNLIQKKGKRGPVFTSNVGGAGGTYLFENKMSYWNRYFTDTVFSILSDLREKPSFIISPGEHRFPKSKIYKSMEEMTQYISIDQIFETNRFLSIMYYFNKEKVLMFLDKVNRKSFLNYYESETSNAISNYSGGILNDYDGGASFLPRKYFTENGREFMIGLIYPYQIKTCVSNNQFKNSKPKYPGKKKELEKLAKSLKETDNPILMIVRLKR